MSWRRVYTGCYERIQRARREYRCDGQLCGRPIERGEKYLDVAATPWNQWTGAWARLRLHIGCTA